jgi:hypothetical protein
MIKMATGDIKVKSSDISDFHCFTCTNEVAVKYCVECQGYCCQSCVDTHSRFPGLKVHTLLDQSNDTVQGTLITLPTMPTERCATHTIKLVDMYCKDHDEVGCSTCMTLKHRYFDTLFITIWTICYSINNNVKVYRWDMYVNFLKYE